MYKKILMLFSAVLLLFTFSTNTAYAADGVMNIDLKGAVERALKQNSDLALLSEKIDLARELCKEATGDEDKREKELDDLLWQLDETKKDIEIETTRLYNQILLNQKSVELQKKVIERLNKEYEYKKKTVELGRDVESSLITCQLNISDAQSELIDLENNVKACIMDLNIEMGDDINQKLILKEENIPDEYLNINDINDIAAKLPDLSHSVISIVKDRKIVQDEYNSASDDKKEELKDQLISLQYDMEDEKHNVALKVLSDYNTLLNLKDSMESKKLELEKYNKLADAAKLKLNLGLISSIDYDKAWQDAQDAQNAFLQSKLDYYIEMRKYKNYIEPALKK